MSCQCLNGSGYKEAEEIRTAAVNYASNWKMAQAIIMAIDNAAQLISNYKKQNDLADESMKIMEANQAHMKDVFWKHELRFLAEFCSPEDLEKVEDVGRRYAGRLVSTVAAQFAKQLHELRCGANKYCASALGKAFQDLSMARAQAIANARILGRMIAYQEHHQLDDLAFSRQVQAAGLGMGLVGQAASFMQKGVTGYSQIGQNLAGRLSDNFTAIGLAMEMRNNPPPRSHEMVSLWDASMTNMEYTPNGFINQTPATGLDMDFAIDSAKIGGFQRTAADTTTAWPGQQNQTQMNNGRVGNWDLARIGQKTYTDYDTYGKPINITVKMSDFPLAYQDSKTEGDT